MFWLFKLNAYNCTKQFRKHYFKTMDNKNNNICVKLIFNLNEIKYNII